MGPTKLFVHLNKSKEPLSSNEIVVFDMEEAVCDMATVIDSAAGNFCYNVSSISPCSS